MEKLKLSPSSESVKSRESLLGCPVANGYSPCNHLCGGGWPGTIITHENMLARLQAGIFNPSSKNICGPISDMAFYWYDSIGIEYFTEQSHLLPIE